MKMVQKLISVMCYFKIYFLLAILIISCNGDKLNDLQEANNSWPKFSGGNKSLQYSPLNQIDTTNVMNLVKAWEYSTGDFKNEKPKGQIQCNPIIIDGILYGTSPKLKLFALDAETSKELWVFDPNKKLHLGRNVNRGICYWEGEFSKRIFYSIGEYLYCINAETGKPIMDFGNKGKISLKRGLEKRNKDLFVVSTSPGIVFDDKIIMGTRVSENANAASGAIQAFNVKTGLIEWVFNTIPRPGEFMFDSWPKGAYKSIGGANSWAGISLDLKRKMIFVPTGSAAYDFYGGNREGDNLFANCIIAINAETGKRIWHYQITHHDLWDRDVPAQPTLITLEKDGKHIDAVTIATKTGHVFVLDRDTGIPIFPVEEREVPKSDIPGEKTSKTQPFPIVPPPFTRQIFDESEITDISSESYNYVKNELKKYRTGSQYLPPSFQGSILFPEFNGGAAWGGTAYDTDNQLLIVNSKEKPGILTLKKNIVKKYDDGDKIDLGSEEFKRNCSMCHGIDKKGNPGNGIPTLINIKDRLEIKEIESIVKNGQGGRMPGFGHLKEATRKAIVNYLLGLKNVEVDPHMLGSESNSSLPYSHTGYNRFYDQEGYPAIKPPWGTLTAINLKEGIIQWQVPLGEYEELTKRGIPKTGRDNLGGPVVTAGGLIFIAATSDEFIRAFNIKTGDEVWKYKLPAGGYATPSVYMVDGKEFVVIACGGGKFKTKSNDKYVAFCLPKK